MKNLILSIVVSLAVVSLPVVAHHPAEDNENMPEGTWEMIDDNLEAVDSPHLDLTFDDMGSDVSDPAGEGSDGMNVNIDADLDRIQAGDQTGTGEDNEPGDAGEDNEPGDVGEENQEGWYLHQEVNFRPGEVAPVDWGQTQTKFRGEMLTSSVMADDGILELYQGNIVKIASELMVDEEDVGQSAQCMVVALYKEVGKGEASRFILSEEGWEGWNGDFSGLTGVKCELGATHRIIAHDGELFSGEYYLYFGYQLKGGKTVYSPEAFSFTIQ